MDYAIEGQGDSTSCKCLPGYSWNASSCNLNCSAIPNTDGVLNSVACKCAAGYTWNLDINSCLKPIDTSTPIDCSQIKYAAGNLNNRTC